MGGAAMSDCCFTLFAALLGAFGASKFAGIIFARRRAKILRRRAMELRDRAAKSAVQVHDVRPPYGKHRGANPSKPPGVSAS